MNAIWVLPFYPSPLLDDGTILVVIATFIPSMERSTISVSSSARRMPAIFGSSPI